MKKTRLIVALDVIAPDGADLTREGVLADIAMYLDGLIKREEELQHYQSLIDKSAEPFSLDAGDITVWTKEGFLEDLAEMKGDEAI